MQDFRHQQYVLGSTQVGCGLECWFRICSWGWRERLICNALTYGSLRQWDFLRIWDIVFEGDECSEAAFTRLIWKEPRVLQTSKWDLSPGSITTLCIYLCYSQQHILVNQRKDLECFLVLWGLLLPWESTNQYHETKGIFEDSSRTPHLPKYLTNLTISSRSRESTTPFLLGIRNLFRCMRKMSFCNMNELATWVAWRFAKMMEFSKENHPIPHWVVEDLMEKIPTAFAYVAAVFFHRRLVVVAEKNSQKRYYFSDFCRATHSNSNLTYGNLTVTIHICIHM